MAEFTFADLPPWAFQKEDPGDDAAFYVEPRLVTHIDDSAIAALTDFYRHMLPAGRVLDLMSSWVSHLPEDVAFEAVVGHGMNAEELAANPRLDQRFVQDLNRAPQLPLSNASLDAATMCVSVQYLQKPVEVLADVKRVLKPGAPLLISFSNRCFPTKAVAIWMALDHAGHAALVELYLRTAGFAWVHAQPLPVAPGGDPMVVVTGRAS
jgi:SAM-dependent methyltransferase